jgi:WD40 repeat protein
MRHDASCSQHVYHPSGAYKEKPPVFTFKDVKKIIKNGLYNASCDLFKKTAYIIGIEEVPHDDVQLDPESAAAAGEAAWEERQLRIWDIGRYMLSGSDDHTVRMWDVASGGELLVFQGHTAGVNSVAFSPDGNIALSGCSDKTVRLWDLESGKELRVFEGHTAQVNSVAFSLNGQFALSGSSDNTICLWELRYENISSYRHPYPL